MPCPPPAPHAARAFLFGSALLAFALAPSPARADHAGPSGAGGGSNNVLSPETLEKGHVAVGLRITQTVPEARSDAELAALAGQHIHAHNADYTLVASLGAAYGVTDRLTLSLELPYVRRDDLREGTHAHVGGVAVNGVEALGTVAGIGDASALARYKLVEGPTASFTFIGGIKLPTGSTHRRSMAGDVLETEHQPGTGSWDPILGAALGSRRGPLRFTASALYQFSGNGAQHTRLGNRAQGGVAASYHVGPSEHHHHEEAEAEEDGAGVHAEEHRHPSWDASVELTGEWEGRQRVDGIVEEASGGTSVWLTPGVRFNAPAGYSIGLAAGLPVWQRIRPSHRDNAYRLTLSLGRAF
jgi:hypothetical protein